MGARGGKNRGVRDGRAVVTVNGAGQGGAQGGNQQGRAGAGAADHGDDGNQHAEGSPGGAHGEAHQGGDDKNQEGEQAQGQVRGADEAGDKLAGADHFAADAAEGPGKNQDQHGGNNTADAADDGGNELLRFHDFAGNVENESGHQSGEGAQGQAGGGVLADGLGEGHAVEEAAHIGHAQDGADNQHQHRQRQVDDPALVAAFILSFFFVFGFLGGGIAFFFSLQLCQAHLAEILAGGADEDHHQNGQQGVEIVGNGGEEHVEAIGFVHVGGDGHRPGGYRRDDADRSRGGVDDVGQLLAGDPLPVVNGPHDGAHGEAVEAVIDEDQHA